MGETVTQRQREQCGLSARCLTKAQKERKMYINDAISEFLGALANMVMETGISSPQLQKEDLNEILKRTKIETGEGFDYQKPHVLIDRAVEYWNKKDRSTVVNNIKTIFPWVTYQ
jgi:hypothetical protein